MTTPTKNARPAPLAEPPAEEAATPPSANAEAFAAPVSADRLSLLLYGGPGTGKTFLAGTAADDARTAPVLFLDLEGGAMTIDWRPGAGQPIKIYGVDVINRAGGLVAVADLLSDGSLAYGPDKIPFATVVLDSMTDESWNIQDEMRGRAKRPNGANANKLDWTEWDEYTTIVRDALRAFTALVKQGKIHFIVTMLDSVVDDVHVPQMKGKGAREMLPALFNTVARLTMEPRPAPNGEGTVPIRRLQLQTSVNTMAKDRSDRLGTMAKTMDDPTVAKLLDRIAEGRRLAIARAAR